MAHQLCIASKVSDTYDIYYCMAAYNLCCIIFLSQLQGAFNKFQTISFKKTTVASRKTFLPLFNRMSLGKLTQRSQRFTSRHDVRGTEISVSDDEEVLNGCYWTSWFPFNLSPSRDSFKSPKRWNSLGVKSSLCRRLHVCQSECSLSFCVAVSRMLLTCTVAICENVWTNLNILKYDTVSLLNTANRQG